MMKRAIAWLINASVFLSLSDTTCASSYILNPHQVDVITKEIGASLKDPYSARFKQPAVVSEDNSKSPPILIVCGLFNAKNGFGAYIGDMPYVGTLYSVGPNYWHFKVASIAGSNSEAYAIINYCSNPNKRRNSSSGLKAEELFPSSDLPGLQPGDLEKIFGR